MAVTVRALLVSLCIAEASVNNEAFENRILAKSDILKDMTTEFAVQKFNNMKAPKNLVSYVQTKLGLTNMRAVNKHRVGAPGYNALEGAKNMLNSMMEEANMKRELEAQKCQEFEIKQEKLMTEARQDISQFNSEAAGARSGVLRAQGQIHVYEEKIPSTQQELDEHNDRCDTEVPALKNQLAIVLADLAIMAKILELTKCDKGAAAALIQCECQNGDTAVAIEDATLTKMLSSLKSDLVKQYVHHELQAVFKHSQHAAVLLDEGMRRNKTFFPPNKLNVTDVPQAPVKPDCVVVDKCNIASNPNCGKLRDRFLGIQAGIEEKKDELSEKLVELEHFCEETGKAYETEIQTMQSNLRGEETSLASSTQIQVTAEAQSHHTGAQFAKLEKEYHQERRQCCTNQNNFLQEVCALEKIRGELYKMEGEKVFISDCEVSDWSPDECTKSCGEGTQQLSRKVVVHPNGGTKCPPLKLQRKCNIQKCPVNCEMSDWGEWSACSAECGGGVIERTRKVKVEPLNGGKVCEAGSQSETCNIQACDVDCDLHDWTDWEPCSKMCGSGTQRHTRPVRIAKKGEGKCDSPTSPERLGFKSCNAYPCNLLVPPGRTTLKCKSKIDVIIMLDGSGSLGDKGWENSKKMAEMLVDAFTDEDYKPNSGRKNDDEEEEGPKVNMAFQQFSGPISWPNYKKCTSSDPETKVDLEKDCGIKWISHFTDDLKELKETVKNMEWMKGTTLTASALAESMSELTYSRKDANSLVIVITDGKPMSVTRTGKMAKRLQQKARLMWVPVGANTPKDLMRKWASKPASDNLIEVLDFASMPKPFTLNTVISSACPKIG